MNSADPTPPQNGPERDTYLSVDTREDDGVGLAETNPPAEAASSTDSATDAANSTDSSTDAADPTEDGAPSTDGVGPGSDQVATVGRPVLSLVGDGGAGPDYHTFLPPPPGTGRTLQAPPPEIRPLPATTEQVSVRDIATDGRHIISRLGRRATALVTDPYLRSIPTIEKFTRRTSELTRRANKLDLIQVAAGAAVTALAALVIAVAAQVDLGAGVLTAPIWLFMGATLLAGTLLGPLRGAMAVGLYLVLGLIGTTWTQGDVSAYLSGPWAGVLLSLPAAALLTGFISVRRADRRTPDEGLGYFFGWFLAAALVGVALVYAGGLWTLYERAEVDNWSVFVTMSARIPFDVAQCLGVAALAAVVHRLMPGLLLTPGARPRRI